MTGKGEGFTIQPNSNEMMKRLQESEELHKQAQALTHIGNWSWDIKTNKINWSDEMYRIYGLQPQSEEISFERFVSLIHPDDREIRISEIQESLQTGIANDYTLRIQNPDGTIKVLKGKGELFLDDKQKPVKLVGTCQDITQEFHLNKKLKENEENLSSLINNAPDAVIVINRNSKITLWNPKTEQIFGWKAEEVLGKDLTETIIPPQYRQAHINGMKRFLDTGEAKVLNKTLELTALSKDNIEFHISLTISKTITAGNLSFIAFIRDISKEKNIQAELVTKSKQLEIKNVELERTNKELESFNYIASHDLQEPLRKIHTFTNRIIEKSEELSPEVLNFFEKITVSTQRMQLLINDLLAFSQTASSTEAKEKVDLNKIIEEVKIALAHNIEENKAVIQYSNLPVINAVEFQMLQLFTNLIGNAIKYRKESKFPKVTIKSLLVDRTEISVDRLLGFQSYHKISIEDNGIGFENIYSEKIFELFTRLHNKNKYSGTGIGLAICKKIAENHNGFITAESNLDTGAVFNVYLPASEK
jgi:PAS domain S-box-containing protein